MLRVAKDLGFFTAIWEQRIRLPALLGEVVGAIGRKYGINASYGLLPSF